MSKLINLTGLARFWTNTKNYIDTALSGKAAASHTHDYAASTHNHAQTEITGLADALAGKAATTHGHAQSEITGLSDALAGKAAASHGHAYSELTGTPTIPTTVAQLTDAGNYALKSEISNVYRYKGSKATVADLPTTGNAVGDVWDVAADGMNYGWTGTEWDELGQIFEIETASTAEIDDIFA